ncbi:TonB-dependent receptor [Chryseosolibacter indicus]|uniref:Carboxypeptidase-like regulatory domain-containing protein n=1 Tax=Chryseosolibacter indicus TaxID=2782351 RepID=A0ABS5VYQ9_9BACT|nr:carboxypeptidase-like regulatory domain-containing protein [Chryseosolibacter indicus]MBT1706064.1 carboxypeptidase-like regulatory domain-containing protein [Chryseosolibacter indicus]
MNRWFCLFFCFFALNEAAAQSIKLKGRINNLQGETLPSAQVSLFPDSITVLTDLNGRFSIETKRGNKQLIISFVGYESHRIHFYATKDSTVTVKLKEQLNQLNAVVVEDVRDRQQEIFNNNQTSTNVLTKEEITGIPVLMGEADVIKTLQLLPGTVRGVEGSSDLFVRGGAADQNLVLLDGAPVYNTSHLFGFLSVFNPDILDKVESINGGFPAHYGGRLSSILNVNTGNTVADRTNISGDIGLISSRLFLEQPLVKDKASFWIGGRRTYIDRVVQLVGEELPYFFYDVNAKLILDPDERNHFEISYYGGEDVLDFFRDRNNDGNGIITTYESGNNSQSFIWKRTFARGLKSELTAMRSKYKYDIRNIFEDNQLLASSNIEDYGGKWTFTKDSLFSKGTLKTGIEWIRHAVSPNVINTTGFIAEFFESNTTSAKSAHEIAAYAEYSWMPIERLNVAAGFRGSLGVLENKKYFNPEPRISARYELNKDQALKLSYSRMSQYIHRISNSAISMPTDIWYPVTDSIKPQTSHQVALAWQWAKSDSRIFLSIESYYKTMQQLIGYEEGTNLFLNTDFESQLIQGKGRAYGFEFLIKKDAGRFTGWISYTLSWSSRQFNDINNGDWFRARYDRRHNGAIVMQYALSKRFSTSFVWEYISGSRFTPVTGQYTVVAPTLTGVDVIPVFAPINSVKLADTHRLDIGIKFRNKPGRKFQWHWFAGVYNIYNRATPIGIVISEDETDGSLSYEQPGLFGLLPFISYGFKL